MVAAFVRSLLAEPRAPDPPVRVWRDWALVGALLVTAVAEAIFRSDVPWRPLATAVALLVIPVLLWRRTHPLLATGVGFGGALVLHIPTTVDDVVDVGLYSMAGVVLLPYALYRWASGPEALIGTAIVAVPAGLGLAASATVGDLIGAPPCWLRPSRSGPQCATARLHAYARCSRSGRSNAVSSPASCTTPSPTTCRPSRSRRRLGGPWLRPSFAAAADSAKA